MDVANSEPHTFLYNSPENNDNIQEFVKIAVSLMKENKKVLLFTRQHVDFMSTLAGLTRDQMQHFIISYHSDINTIIGKLLELQNWTILPDFVILNLNSFYDKTNAGIGGDVNETKPQFDKICLCISTLLNYMRFLRTKRCAKSAVLLNSHADDVKVQLLIDFYFYKRAAFSEIDGIRDRILNEVEEFK